MRSHSVLSAASIELEGYARGVRTAPVPLLLAVVLAASCGGGGSSEAHGHYLYMQKCASCHGVSADARTPDEHASNLLAANPKPGVEQVRRAIIDGRPGMPKGLAGGRDVDAIAEYLAGQLR